MITYGRLVVIAMVIAAGIAVGYARLGTSRAEPAQVALPGVAEYVASLDGVPDFQRELIKDGVVTLAEYEVAIARVLECGAVDGWVAEPVPGEGLRPTRIGFRFEGPVDSTTPSQQERAFSACRAEFYDEVSVVWALQQNEAGSGLETRAYDALNRCFDGAFGPPFDKASLAAELAEPGDDPERGAFMVTFLQCSLDVEAATGYALP